MMSLGQIELDLSDYANSLKKNIGVGFTWKKLENYFHSEKASKKKKTMLSKSLDMLIISFKFNF